MNTRKPSPGGVSRRAAFSHLGGAGLAAGMLAADHRGAAAQISAESAETEAVVRQVLDAINAILAGGEGTALNALFAPDYVNHTPYRSPESGALFSPDLTGLQSALSALRGTVPDAVLTIEEVVASGDTAAARVTLRGTVEATAADTSEVTAYPLTVGGIAIARVGGRQIIESWDYDEAAELFGGPVATPGQPEVETVSDEEGIERREIADVAEVAVQGIGTLLLAQGDTESLTIEAEPRALRRIGSEVQNGRLTIGPVRSMRTREPVTYTLTVKNLTAIELSGTVQAEVGAFAAQSLRLALDGASGIAIADLTAERLEVTASGNVTVSLAGTTTTQTVSLNGSSRYTAAELESEEASLTVSGASQATVQAATRLDVQISGAGSVVYSGNPEISQDISGAGSLTPAE